MRYNPNSKNTALITVYKVQHAEYWVEIPQINLKILCGCPENSIKHLRKKGLVYPAEKAGVFYEEGPNAILLSDLPVQKKRLSNLTEFPILQILYRQGLLISGHPNHGDINLIMLGTKQQIEAQLKYVYCGNYGITDEDEYMRAGVDREQYLSSLRAKMFFAYGRFVPSSELIDQVVIEKKRCLIRNGAYIRRIEPNIFEISFRGTSVCIDLNLKKNQAYRSTYRLPKCQVPDAGFAIAHIGEGDGWDYSRPCIGSLVIHKNRRFLIDTGPHISQTLRALGIKHKEIDGVYFTHVHDDHFAGLFSLLRIRRKLAIYATKSVYLTIVKKLAALLDKKIAEIEKTLNFNELKDGAWNNNYGLEVKPIESPHPVDTTLFIMRVKSKGGYKTYGHFSDIAALKVLKQMVNKDDQAAGISRARYNELRKLYRLSCDLKKVDVGGQAIHGNSKDFINDPSTRLIFSHTTEPLDNLQLKIGSQAKFGEIDILIP